MLIFWTHLLRRANCYCTQFTAFHLSHCQVMSTDKKEKRLQPSWQPPETKGQVHLKLYNSLTREKEEFHPQNGKQVLWYTCGPTVYDSSHMGHARTYISLDILRRVMRDYFKYDILYCMNVTDIDDKIIKRARQNYLFDSYVKANHTLDVTLKDAVQALELFKVKTAAETDKDKQAMNERIKAKVTACVSDLELWASSGDRKSGADDARQKVVEDCKDILADWLDSQHGADITDNSIFTDLPRFFEEDFHEDMKALNVLPADVVTRVSDYVPEVVEYIQKIIDRGYAYEVGGSVYFDTSAFSQAKGHYYAKLVPEAFGDSAALKEGEGVLTADHQTDKRNASDFALWKASKSGEPFWPSPWGQGRPGWHIECSVMASKILGDSLDIHTGGFDLKFPHHDNEIAQAEAHFDNDHWVRYFLHTGHLTIQGCKMSKSLKNFITIKDALKKNTARQLRFVFLLHSWKDTLDYSDNTMELALKFEKLVSEFFLNVKHVLRISPSSGVAAFEKWNNLEIDLNTKFMERKQAVHECLCDSINTHGAMINIRELIGHVNIYLSDKRGTVPNRTLLLSIAQYVCNILKIFGAIDTDESIGFSQSSGETINVEETVMPYLSVLADFRERIRQEARVLKAGSILGLCDELRDITLPELGVRLEDHDNVPSSIKLVDRETLLKEKSEKLRVQEEKRLEKEQKKKEQEAEKARLEALKRLPPSQMFLHETDKYSQFDDKGLPTHDVQGKELSKSQIKKLSKLYEAQEKRYQETVKHDLNDNKQAAN